MSRLVCTFGKCHVLGGDFDGAGYGFTTKVCGCPNCRRSHLLSKIQQRERTSNEGGAQQFWGPGAGYEVFIIRVSSAKYGTSPPAVTASIAGKAQAEQAVLDC